MSYSSIRQSNLKIASIITIIMIIISCTVTQLCKINETYTGDVGILYCCWVVVFSIILLSLFSGKLKGRSERIMVFVSWIIRVVHVTAMRIGLYYFTLSGDEKGFVKVANEYFVGNDSVNYYTNMPYIINASYQIFGKDDWTFSLFNSFLVLIAVYFVVNSLRELDINGRIRVWMIGLIALNPVAFLLCAVPLREGIYLVLSAASLYFVILWVHRKRERYIVIAIVLTIPMIWLHTGNVAISFGYLMTWYLFPPRKSSINRFYKLLVLLLIIVVGLVYIIRGNIPYIGNIGSIGNIFSVVMDNFNKGYSYVGYTSGSTVLRWMTSVTSIGQLILFTPLRMMEFLFSPMPWDVYRIRDLFGMLADGLIYFAAMVVFLRYRKVIAEQKNDIIILRCIVITMLVMAIVFGWGTITSGTALRHRNCLLPMVCVLIGMLVTRYRERQLIKWR